jgi:hypothetical protein
MPWAVRCDKGVASGPRGGSCGMSLCRPAARRPAPYLTRSGPAARSSHIVTARRLPRATKGCHEQLQQTRLCGSRWTAPASHGAEPKQSGSSKMIAELARDWRHAPTALAVGRRVALRRASAWIFTLIVAANALAIIGLRVYGKNISGVHGWGALHAASGARQSRPARVQGSPITRTPAAPGA